MHVTPDRRIIRGLSTVLAVGLLASAAPAGSEESGSEWPQFRGPNRDGVSAETGLLDRWPADGPRERWRVDLGSGFSGISVSGGRAYTMFGADGSEYLGCFDAADGKRIWRVRVDSNFRDRYGDGPRSTPTVDNGAVYALGAQGKLSAVSAADGKTLWTVDLQEKYGAAPPRWGVSMSPLVEGSLLLVDVGGRDGSSVVAFDKKSGKEVWRSQGDKAGYSAPIAVTFGGLRQVVFLTARKLVGLAPEDGRELWSFGWKTSYDVNASTPVFVPPNRIFISTGYDVGAALLQIEVEGGKARVKEVWKSRVMKNKFSSSVLRDGHLYGFDEKTLKCIDVESGEMKWQHRSFGHGSLIYADGKLIVLGDGGQLALVEATPEEYREKSRVQVFDGKTWTMPTLVDGKLYLRDEHVLISFDVRG